MIFPITMNYSYGDKSPGQVAIRKRIVEGLAEGLTFEDLAVELGVKPANIEARWTRIVFRNKGRIVAALGLKPAKLLDGEPKRVGWQTHRTFLAWWYDQDGRRTLPRDLARVMLEQTPQHDCPHCGRPLEIQP